MFEGALLVRGRLQELRPQGLPCLQVGEYCGTYVSVTASGQDELTKLTLAILDYAQNAPPTMRTKQVVYYIDEYGLPTTQKESVGNVTATINIDEKDASLLNGTTTEEARLEQIVRGQLHSVEEQLREWDKIKDQLGDGTAQMQEVGYWLSKKAEPEATVH